MNKQASMSISLWILVIGTFFLIISSLTIFYAETNSMKNEVLFINSFDDIYAKESQVNFYINNLIDKSVKETLAQDFPEDYFAETFSDIFRNNLLLYKSEDNFLIPELSQIENQINSESIKYSKKTKILEITLNILLEHKIKEESGREVLSVTHSYSKTFTRNIGKI